MTKNIFELPQPEESEALLPVSERAGMFGRGYRRPRNPLVPDIATPPPSPYPFSDPASALTPNSIDNLVRNLSIPNPLAIDAWAKAAPTGGLPAGPDILFAEQGAAMPAAPASAPHYRQMPPDIIAAAQADQRRTGVPASVNMAQWMIEGGWGRHVPPDSYNYWGIKEPDPRKPRVKVWTNEKDPTTGKLKRVQAYFRKFASPEEGWAAHRELLSKDPRYAKAMALTHDPDAFVDAIANIYATAPNYAQAIKDAMRKNHLYQYNTLPQK